MGYERNPRNASGGNDDRGYGRDGDWNRDNEGRDSYGYNRASQPPGRDDDFGQRDRGSYGNDAYGDRSSHYRRDSGFQPQGGYDRNAYGSNTYGNDSLRSQNYGRSDQQRGRAPQSYGRPPQGYDYDDRGFFDRAGDEVRSWFGDDEANRRRDLDARYDEQRYGANSDDHYHNWRRSQIDALDRDYDEYRRENRSQFDSEFGSWRNQRQTQRSSLSQVNEHMDVVGSDGAHIGTVDKVRGDRIILTKSDADAGGRHHSIPSRWIHTVDDKVTISKTADDAKAHWRDEERSQAFFGEGTAQRDDQTGKGPHILGRSFTGTY